MRKVFVAMLALLLMSAAARAGQVTYVANFNDMGFINKPAGQELLAFWNPSPFDALIPRYNDFARPLIGVSATFTNSISIGDGLFTYRHISAGLVNSTIHTSWNHVSDDLMINQAFLSQNAFSGTLDHSYGGDTFAIWGLAGQNVLVPGGFPDMRSLTVNLPTAPFLGSGSFRMDVPINTTLDFLDPEYLPFFDFSAHIHRSGSFRITYTFLNPPPPPAVPTPEPSTIATLAAGLLVVGVNRLRRKNAR